MAKLLLIKNAVMTFAAIFLIITITFVIMKAIPGDPLGDEKSLPKEIHEALLKHYGLHEPLWIQYKNYVFSALQGNFGPSLVYKDKTVNEIIKTGFPISAALGMEALCLALTIGITAGTVSAIYSGRWPDRMGLVLSCAAISIPSFISAALLQYLFAYKLGIFPVARWGTFSQAVLPALALAAMPTAYITRLIRSNILDILSQDYIKAAKAKGLSNGKIYVRHILKNSITPMLGYLGPLTANILTGSFVIEKIFGIPGLGRWFVMSVANRDYPLIMGVTVFYSMILLGAILLMDSLRLFLDPRQRLTV